MVKDTDYLESGPGLAHMPDSYRNRHKEPKPEYADRIPRGPGPFGPNTPDNTYFLTNYGTTSPK